VNFDPDTAGANAAEKSIALLTEEGFEVRVLTLEGGLDPDRYVRERGARGYAEALRGAPALQKWLIDRAKVRFPSDDPKSKVESFNFLLPYIRRMPTRVERESFAMDAAQALQVDFALFSAELKQAVARRQDSVEIPKSFPLSIAEQTLLRAFSSPRSSEAYLAAEGAWHEHGADLSRLRQDLREIIDELRDRKVDEDPLAAISSDQNRQMLASVFISVHDAEPEIEGVEQAILALRRGSLLREQRITRASIAVAERNRDHREVASETLKLQDILRRLRSLD
jgi:DNA primase